MSDTCLCAHVRERHFWSRDRLVCAGTACGCARFRPRLDDRPADEPQTPPAADPWPDPTECACCGGRGWGCDEADGYIRCDACNGEGVVEIA